MSDKVVYLAYSNPNDTKTEEVSFLCCSYCTNKTYTLTYDKLSPFPMLKCCVCSAHIGRVGWAENEDAQ